MQQVVRQVDGMLSSPIHEEPIDWSAEYGIHHVALIPDGNRRWAQERSMEATLGHTVGLLTVLPRIIDGLCDRGVHTITAWGFSTENWARVRVEVDHLMAIFAEFLRDQVMELANRHQARLVHIGRRDRLPDSVVTQIDYAVGATKHYDQHVFNMAIDYGGEDELARAAERMLSSVREGHELSGESLRDFLDTAGQPFPNPDVIIRSSGEHRLSGFMPLQSSYSELFFVKEQFPEFNMDLLDSVGQAFNERKRRFGT